MKKILIFVVLFNIFMISLAFAASPVLFFSDLADGPKTGWEGSSTKGCAVTVWGKNFGSSRGSNYINVCGANLTQSSDYAEWGVTTNNARGLERITFWLNSGCNNGAGTISVSVDGVTSNTLPFTVRSGNIYFVAQSDGNNSYNGQYASSQGGSNGPWKTIAYGRQQLSSGDILYIRSGTYDDADSYSSILYLPIEINGSADNHTAFIGYPGEFPVLDGVNNGHSGVIRNNFSNTGYTVFSKFKILPWSTAIRLQKSTVGHYRIIGLEIDGQGIYPDHQVQAGAIGTDCVSYVDILGNHIYDWGYDKYDHGMYIGTYVSTQNVEYYDIGWNEVHGLGTDVSGIYIHPKDSDTTTPKKYADEIDIHDNLCYDLEHAGIHLASRVADVRLYNNVIYDAGSASSRAVVHFNLSSDTTSDVKFYNNTLYSSANSAMIIFQTDANVTIKNNIVYSLSSTDYYTDSNYTGSRSSDYDLWYGNGAPPAWATNAINSDPLFVNASNNNFHLQGTSPAANTGTSDVSSIVTQDYDGTTRPVGGAVDIGAYEYTEDSTAPSAVNNIAVSNVTPTSVTLAWTAPGDDGDIGTADSYDIRYHTSIITEDNWASATQCTGEPTPQSAGNSESFVVSGLTTGTKYYFALKTSDGTNTSGISNCIDGTPHDAIAPSAVSNLTADTGSNAGEVNLTWTAPGDDGSSGRATSYDIRYSLAQITEANWASATQVTGEPTPKVSGASETFTVTGLTPGTLYYFALKTSDEYPNTSGISNIPSAVAYQNPQDTMAPSAVNDLSASSGTSEGAVKLTWTAPGDDGSSGTATSYDVRYSIFSINESNWNSSTQITGEPTPKLAGSTEAFTVDGLTPGKPHYFALKTSDEVPNTSGISNSANAVAYKDTTAPSAISDLSATQGANSGEIGLTWTAPGDDGSTGTATQYDIRYSLNLINETNWASATQLSNEPTPSVAGTKQSCTISGLTPGTLYYFAIKTSDEIPNTSAISNTASATAYQPVGDITPPSAVSDMSGDSGPNIGEVVLTWTAPGGDGDTGTAASYDIRYATSSISESNWGNTTQGTNEPTPKPAGFQETFTVTGLTVGQTYYFALKSRDSVGNISGISNSPAAVATAPVSDTTSPDAVVDLVAVSGTTSGEVVLGWTASGDDGNSGIATNYDVRYATFQITDATWDSASQPTGEPPPQIVGEYEVFTLSNLTPSVNYYFALKVADEVPNWSGISNSVNATAYGPDITPPAAVKNLSASTGSADGEVILGWTAPGDDGNTGTVSYYEIRYSRVPILEQNYWYLFQDEVDWTGAIKYNQSPTPKAAGNSQNFPIQGLKSALNYYFSMKSFDDAGNSSAMSNVASAVSYNSDTTAPLAVVDLITEMGSGDGEVILHWTASGDDGTTGTAGSYDIRYAQVEITESNWASASQCSDEPTPKISEKKESFTVTGLTTKQTYYFALKVIDDVNNISGISNSPSGIAGRGEDLSNVRTYPNPWTKDAGYSSVYVTHLTEKAKVKIYNISGELIREMTEQSGVVEWDMKNNNGEEVASGVYIYVAIDDAGHKKIGKVAVIK